MCVCAKPSSKCSADVLRTPMYLLNCIGCITCIGKLYQFYQLYHLYRTSFTSCTVPVLPVPKSAPNRAYQKNNAHFAENDTNFTENNAHFTKNNASILVQYSQRTDSVQYSGSVRLVHSVRYSWYTWCSTNGTLSAALVIQLAQDKH